MQNNLTEDGNAVILRQAEGRRLKKWANERERGGPGVADGCC